MRSSRALEMIMPWMVTIGIFIVWEIGCLAFNVPAFVLPRPSVFMDVLLRLHEARACDECDGGAEEEGDAKRCW